jgi:DNA-binding winged helix-turn-helix (wHTH) protein
MVSYRFGPYRLMPDQRRLEHAGEPVPLTPRAFDLLVALVTHRSRALSKDEILALVWPDANVEEGNLAQQTLVLRRALRDLDGCVATIPRHGYQFVASVSEEGEAAEPPGLTEHCLRWDQREFSLRAGITVIGRAEDADLRIPLPSVSRRHARVVVQGMEAHIEDLGSRHGSWLGPTPIDTRMRLATGDQIRLGTALLEYRVVLPSQSTSD